MQKNIISIKITHLNHPVLWGPSPLPLEHGVDVGGHGHGDGLLGVHVPLLGVLVELVVVQSLEGRVVLKDYF